MTVAARSWSSRCRASSPTCSSINLGLGVFNLIPLPPLDGGHFLPYFLPRASWGALHKLEQYGPIILILAVMSGATRYVVRPALRVAGGRLRLGGAADRLSAAHRAVDKRKAPEPCGSGA